MRKNLNEELKAAFSELDEERVKSLLAAGADRNCHVRNEMLDDYMGPKAELNLLPERSTDTDEQKAHKAQENMERRQKYKEELARDKRDLKVIKLLLVNGANPNWVNPWPNGYDTAFLNCLSGQNFDKAQVLVDNGARVDMHNCGDTALTWFSTRLDYDASLETIKFLYKNGANLNAKNIYDGRTALMKMTGFSGFTDTCEFEDLKWLLEPIKFVVSHGANVNLRDKEGKTALNHSLSQEWGQWDNYHYYDRCEYTDNFLTAFYYEIPKILLLNGARISIADKSGKDAMDIAAESEEKMDLFAHAIDDANKLLRSKTKKYSM